MSTRDQLVDRMESAAADVRTLAGLDTLTGAQAVQLRQVEAEFDNAHRALLELDRAAIERRIRRGDVRLESGSDDERAPRPARSEARGKALDTLNRLENVTDLGRSTLDAAARWVDEDETRGDKMAEWVRVAGDPDYRSAFVRLVRSPQMGHMEWSESERAAFAKAQDLKRAMSLSDPAGGYLVPFSLDPTVVLTSAGTSNVNLRQAFTVRTVASDVWNGTTSAGVTASWDAEASEVSDDSPTLGTAAIPTRMGRAFVPFSFEVESDAAGGLEPALQPLLNDAREALEAAAFVNGDGVTGPKGIVTAVTAVGGSVVASTTADQFAVGDLYRLKTALPARHRANAAWLAADSVYDMIRQFAQGSGPQTAFWVDLGGATPPRLLGKPAYESSEMDGVINATQNNYLAIYGDLRQYYVVDRVGATVELIPHLFGANRRPTGQRGLLLWWRTGGDLVNPDAVRVLNV